MADRPEKPKRKAVSKSRRFAIFARDNFACRYCGAQSDQMRLVVDHIIPVAEGGSSEDDNLITACDACNQGKAAKRLDQVAPTEADRLRMAQERQEIMAAARAAADAVEAHATFKQNVVDLWCGIRGTTEADARTIGVMVSYASRYGIPLLAEWIGLAQAKLPTAGDSALGMYVSGIRRTLIERGELDEEGY